MTNDDLIRLYKYYSDVAYAHLKMGYTEESLLNARHVIAKALDVLRLLSIRYTSNEPHEMLIQDAQFALNLLDRMGDIEQSLKGLFSQPNGEETK